MKLIVKNDLVIENPTDEIKEFCKNNLIIDNKDYLTALRLGKYTGNMQKKIKLYVERADSLILPFGCLRKIFPMCKSNYEVKIHDFLNFLLKGWIKLYDYQENAKNRLKSAKNGVLEAPCGSGKTNIGLQLIREIGGRALWLTHTKKLLTQSYDRCKKYFEGDFGIISEGEVKIGRDITFATVQTMCKIDPNIYMNAFDVVVVDECHHCVGSPTNVMQFYKVLTNCNCRYKYGLSATLSRSDNMITSLYAILGDKVHTITKEEVGDKIIKAEYVPIKVEINANPKEYLDFDGTLNFNKLINFLSYNKKRNEIIVENVLKNKGKKQLILCHRVEHVNYLARLLNAESVTGKSKNRKYESDIIVATYSLATEGLDIPDLEILHMTTPQKTERIVKQCTGRVERNIEGKSTPKIYDYYEPNIPYCANCQIKRRRIIKRN